MHLTSAKVPEELYSTFMVEGLRNNLTIQKLVERSMYLYLTNTEFKNQINNQLDTKIDG